ncbi:MAG: hypothetical protein ACTS4X_01945 [Candidatus Hodgkinia cicadicola]
MTGRIERGIVKVGDELELVGFKPISKTIETSRLWRSLQYRRNQLGSK